MTEITSLRSLPLRKLIGITHEQYLAIERSSIFYMTRNSIGDVASMITIRIWTIRMAGIPYRKYQCFVLCLKRCIPAMEPMLPPIRASTKRVDSGMRHERFRAFDLSTPIAAKLIKLTTARYTSINVIAFISDEFFAILLHFHSAYFTG